MTLGTKIAEETTLDSGNYPARLGIGAHEQDVQHLCSAIVKDLAGKLKLAPKQQRELDALVSASLTASIQTGMDPFKAKQQLETQLKDFAKNIPKDFSAVISSISQILHSDQTKGNAGTVLGITNEKFALDLFKEISSPNLIVLNQGKAITCGETCREFIKKYPAAYVQCMADVYNEGRGFTYQDKDGIRYGCIDVTENDLKSFARNKRQSIPMCIYQDAILRKYGSLAEGLKPKDAERFFDASGQASRLLTTSSEISTAPQKINEVTSAIQECSRVGKRGSVSLDFSEKGNGEEYHILEICPQEAVTEKGFVKLNNPWDVREKLPERYKDHVKNNGDGTLSFSIDFLKKNIYFAVVETGKSSDFDNTAGVVEGQYEQGDVDSLVGQQYGFKPVIKSSEKKTSQVAKNEVPERKVSTIPQDDVVKGKREALVAPESDFDGKRYFASLSSGALFQSSKKINS